MMHSINELRTLLGLSSTNQVRNRIEAIKELLLDHIRRGPNNQILLTEEGVGLLRMLKELHEGGLTLTEASYVLKYDVDKKHVTSVQVSPSIAQNRKNPEQASSPDLTALRKEIALLRERVACLEQRFHLEQASSLSDPPWWSTLWEDVDVA